MNQPFHLYRLQQIDTQIDQAEANISTLNSLLAGDEAVLTAKRESEEAARALHQAQQRMKEADFAVSEQQLKISQSEAKLYSGKLHNPKELQDLQKEIASLQKYLKETLENHQLEAMIALEECETRDSAARAAELQAQASFAEKSAGWLGKKEQEVRLLERLKSERAAALSLVTAESLQIYTALRRRKSGVAVTTARDGACTVCGATIRPSEIQAARAAQDFVYCTSCGRILYAG